MRNLNAGRFLLLGSASIDLLQQSGETLAGRIAFVELGPLDVLEVGEVDYSALWRESFNSRDTSLNKGEKPYSEPQPFR